MRTRFSTPLSWTVLFLSSATLILATLWVRSLYVADQVEISAWLGGRGIGLAVLSGSGKVDLYLGPWLNTRRIVHFSRLPSSMGPSSGMPYWLPLSICALVAAGIQCRRYRRRAAAFSLCSNCGYDLRASHERCPECGTPIPGHAQEVPS